MRTSGVGNFSGRSSSGALSQQVRQPAPAAPAISLASESPIYQVSWGMLPDIVSASVNIPVLGLRIPTAVSPDTMRQRNTFPMPSAEMTACWPSIGPLVMSPSGCD